MKEEKKSFADKTTLTSQSTREREKKGTIEENKEVKLRKDKRKKKKKNSMTGIKDKGGK